MRMNEEIIGHELLDTNVRRDCKEVSRHNIANADPVKSLGHLGLLETCLCPRANKPAQEDSP